MRLTISTRCSAAFSCSDFFRNRSARGGKVPPNTMMRDATCVNSFLKASIFCFSSRASSSQGARVFRSSCASLRSKYLSAIGEVVSRESRVESQGPKDGTVFSAFDLQLSTFNSLPDFQHAIQGIQRPAFGLGIDADAIDHLAGPQTFERPAEMLWRDPKHGAAHANTVVERNDKAVRVLVGQAANHVDFCAHGPRAPRRGFHDML